MRLPPVVWSEDLAAWAQEWADFLIAERMFRHRPRNRYGENLYEIDGGRATPQRVVAAWAAEARDYDYVSNACRGQCGHYTQIIWRDTRKVGCAVARDAHRQVWVCNYAPAGNVVGQRPY